jgi:hypothetical protein
MNVKGACLWGVNQQVEGGGEEKLMWNEYDQSILYSCMKI